MNVLWAKLCTESFCDDLKYFRVRNYSLTLRIVMDSCMYINVYPSRIWDASWRSLIVCSSKKKADRSKQVVHFRQDHACTVFLIQSSQNLALICFLPSTFNYSYRIYNSLLCPGLYTALALLSARFD